MVVRAIECVGPVQRCSWGTVGPSAVRHTGQCQLILGHYRIELCSHQGITTHDALNSIVPTIPPEQVLKSFVASQIEVAWQAKSGSLS